MDNDIILEENVVNDSASTSSDSSEALVACQAQVAEWKDRAMRITAEFDNYKRRQERDRQQADYFAQRSVIVPLLTIIDNFQRAQEQHAENPSDMKHFVEGMGLVTKDLEKYLTKVGLEPITASTNFDPEIHEAVMQVADSGQESGTIVKLLEPGYRFKGYILRPAKVSVAQ